MKIRTKALISIGAASLAATMLVVVSACNNSPSFMSPKAVGRWEATAPAGAATGPESNGIMELSLSGGGGDSARLSKAVDGLGYYGAPEFDLQALLRATAEPNSITRNGDVTGDVTWKTGGRALPPFRDDTAPPNILDYPAGSPLPDELLIIERKEAEKARAAEEAASTALGSGGLVCTVDDKTVTVPLKHTDVKGSITGYVSAVSVKQQFTNPYSSKIEAVYVFPLPENAAVSDFVMTIGDRNIRGIIREREEAQQIYTQARAQGYTASLLTQERPNIFTQKVANIEPGRAIDINITYYSTLTYSDGGYEFVFPMVVGPRFNPPGAIEGVGEGVGAVAKGGHGASGQRTEVQYVRPTERTGHDISLALDIDAGVSIESLESRTHRIETKRSAPNRAIVKLSSSDKIPNRDFVLRWQVAGDSIKSAILAHKDAKGGYFTMMLVPPKDLKRVTRNAVEMIFVLDRSGSMEGLPMQQAQRAIARGLERLQPGDTFQILDFAESASQMGESPVLASNVTIAKGQRYLASLDANGGTYMIKGLNAALDFPHDSERLRFVAFCTDGFIGNEAEVLEVLSRKLGATRVFSFGVGNSVNRYLMDSMARMGSGFATYLGTSDDPSTIMDNFFDRVSHAPMSDIKINWGGAQVSEVYPSRVPDLFEGRPVILTGKFNGTLPSSVRVSGRMGKERREISVTTSNADDATSTNALSQVWARAKLTDIADQAAWNVRAQAELAQAARKTALDYCLMSPYTAFIAVDSSIRTSGNFGTTVAVPVPVPDGVRYETTVTEK